jgi:galactose mutarotase-like enzyme
MSGVEAFRKENVVIRAGDCSVTILPCLGGKIASIRIGEKELLQSPLAAYAPRTRTMSFDSGDASGWDECLPSVAACEVQTANGLAAVPDHGDLWRVEWAEKAGTTGSGTAAEPGAAVTLTGECFSLPLTLERAMNLSETGAGWKLQLDYTLRNRGTSPAPWSWAVHPLFLAEEGDRIVLPGSISTLRVEGSGRDRLGKQGDTVNWPVATLADGTFSDLSQAQAASAEIGDKLFTGPLQEAENWCALERPGAGIRIKFGFDTDTAPYLGLWICYGGWPERPGLRQTCVALEPATTPRDSLADSGPWSRVLDAGESYQWSMTVEFQSI